MPRDAGGDDRARCRAREGACAECDEEHFSTLVACEPCGGAWRCVDAETHILCGDNALLRGTTCVAALPDGARLAVGNRVVKCADGHAVRPETCAGVSRTACRVGTGCRVPSAAERALATTWRVPGQQARRPRHTGALLRVATGITATGTRARRAAVCLGTRARCARPMSALCVAGTPSLRAARVWRLRRVSPATGRGVLRARREASRSTQRRASRRATASRTQTGCVSGARLGWSLAGRPGRASRRGRAVSRGVGSA